MSASPVVDAHSSTLVVWYKHCLDVTDIEVTIGRPPNLATLGIVPHASKHSRHENGRGDQRNDRRKLHPRNIHKQKIVTICYNVKKVLIILIHFELYQAAGTTIIRELIVQLKWRNCCEFKISRIPCFIVAEEISLCYGETLATGSHPKQVRAAMAGKQVTARIDDFC